MNYLLNFWKKSIIVFFFFRLILDPCKEVVQYSVYSVYKVSRVKMKVCSSSTSD